MISACFHKLFLFSSGFQPFDYDAPQGSFLCTNGYAELFGFLS